MAPSFRVLASDTALSAAADAADAAAAPLPPSFSSSSPSSSDVPQLFQRVWTVTSEKHQLQTLHIKVPGRVFVDHDSALSPLADSLESADDAAAARATGAVDAAAAERAADPAASSGASGAAATTAGASNSTQPTATDTAASAATAADTATSASAATATTTDTDRTVAKIVVTSSSRRLLDDLLEVVPLRGEKETAGVRFHVKNQNAVLPQCAVLTQIFVSAASAIRELLSNGADVVIGECVVVQCDPDAALQLKCINSGDAFLTTASGFSLASFSAFKRGSGDLQIQTPSLVVRDTLNVTSGHARGGVLLAADMVRAKMMFALAMMAPTGTRVVSNNLVVSDTLMIWNGLGGNVTIAGRGTAAHHMAIISSGVIDTRDIVSDKVGAFLYGGSVVAQTRNELRVLAIGAGRVQYAGERPALINERAWFRWRCISGDLVSPCATGDEAEAETETQARGTQSFELRAHPPREPKVVDVRVRKSWFGSEPKIETDKPSPSAAGLWWRWTLAGSTAVAAAAGIAVVIVVAAKRKQ